MPNFDKSLIGFQVEYLFQYNDEDWNPYTGWCDGVIESIANIKTRVVVIRWNEKKVAEGDALKSKHKWLCGKGTQNHLHQRHGGSFWVIQMLTNSIKHLSIDSLLLKFWCHN